MLTESFLEELILTQKRIAAALENDPQEDGFCDIPTDIRYIFLDGKYPSYWYMLDGAANRLDCPRKAISGTLQCLNLTTAIVGGEEKQKLDVWLKTSHCIYVLRTGWESNACKSLLGALAGLTDNLLKGQIILSPYKLGDKGVDVEKSNARDALFFDVWSQSGKVMGSKREEQDCFQLLKQINFLLIGEAILSPKDKNRFEAPQVEINTPIAPAFSSQLLTREQLLEQSSQLVRDLGWDSSRGREFLVKHYGVKGRSLLSDEQLIQFVGKLQELAAMAYPPAQGAIAA